MDVPRIGLIAGALGAVATSWDIVDETPLYCAMDELRVITTEGFWSRETITHDDDLISDPSNVIMPK